MAKRKNRGGGAVSVQPAPSTVRADVRRDRSPDVVAAGGNVFTTAKRRAELARVMERPTRPQVEKYQVSERPNLLAVAQRLNRALRAEPEREPFNKDDLPPCKDRPRDTRGAGGSRPFVPWCSRKR